jgi:hypothetical protein
MGYEDINWDEAPEATHYCPDTVDNYACFYKQDIIGRWLGKLANQKDSWGYNVEVDEHTLENMITKR